jgi:hypothetical protein
MGFEKLINFLNYGTNNNSIEYINIDESVRKIVAKHIFFDISFIIYKSLIEIESEINDIIKIILSLPFYLSNIEVIEEKLNKILDKKHWNNFNMNILNGNSEDDIISNFISYIKSTNILQKIIINNIYETIKCYIINLHYLKVLISINIVFDGIPSYSKILEQRRRRLKNYLESKKRKECFELYFKNYENNYDLKYNLFKWIKYRFTIDKSFGPISPLIKEIEKYLFVKLKNDFSNLTIRINFGSNNGEADYKIFNDIYNYNYLEDIVIHTIDSDLVHQIIIQQNYFNLINKDISLYVIKYNTNSNIVQYIDAQLLNKNIINVYNTVNNITKCSLYIIYDLALIFYFFGNDHFPSSDEISSELNLEYYCISHYKTFLSSNNYIIKLDDKTNNIIFDLNNLKLYLIEINKNNTINKTKIKLGKYFKLNYNLSSYLTDKLKLDFDNIKLLCKKILYDDAQKYDNKQLDEDDLRFKLKTKYKELDYPVNINNIDTIQIAKLLSCLDVSDTEDNNCGLPVYIKQFYLSDDPYENLYLHFNDLIVNELTVTYPIIFESKENINIQNIDINLITDSFLQKLYHLVYSLFGDMKNYNSNNFTYYIGYELPSLNNIINYLETNNIVELNNKWLINIEKENYNINNYFNSINHYLIITPYIKEILYKFKTCDFKYFVENINVDNMWIDLNDTHILYKNIDYIKYLNAWKETLIKLLLTIKTSPKILAESEQYLLNWI